jgi:hypothetical protein
MVAPFDVYKLNFKHFMNAGSGACGPTEPPSGQYCSQARMLPASSWPAPATVPQADTYMPVPRMAKIARARLNPRNRSRVIRTSYDPFIETKTITFAYNTSLPFLIFFRIQIADIFEKYLYGVS